MEQKYYQGMLRKHKQLQDRFDSWISDPAHAPALEEALQTLDSGGLGEERPTDASPEMLLLWELRQTSLMLDAADQALNMTTEMHEISGWPCVTVTPPSFTAAI